MTFDTNDFEVPNVKMSELNLIHSGKLGMKWGQRNSKKNINGLTRTRRKPDALRDTGRYFHLPVINHPKDQKGVSDKQYANAVISDYKSRHIRRITRKKNKFDYNSDDFSYVIARAVVKDYKQQRSVKRLNKAQIVIGGLIVARVIGTLVSTHLPLVGAPIAIGSAYAQAIISPDFRNIA